MKKHFFLFVFTQTEAGAVRTASVSMGVEHNRVTQGSINEARGGAGVSATAPLINVSYLGHMTQDEFMYEAQ